VETRARIARWEALGALWIIATGVPLHFLYSATGWEAVAWLAPINESTWEHFKLVFWPGLAWAAIEWWRLPSMRSALWTAKLAALVSMPIVIATIFYSYTAVLGANILAVDIGTFIVAVAAGQWIGYRTWITDLRWKTAPWVIVLLAALFVVFSFLAPSYFLFQAPSPPLHQENAITVGQG
jgi:hypothetical protein